MHFYWPRTNSFLVLRFCFLYAIVELKSIELIVNWQECEIKYMDNSIHSCWLQDCSWFFMMRNFCGSTQDFTEPVWIIWATQFQFCRWSDLHLWSYTKHDGSIFHIIITIHIRTSHIRSTRSVNWLNRQRYTNK